MAAATPQIRRLTADEAIRMVRAGILSEDEPLELIDGTLVQMSPQGPAHSENVASLADRLRVAYAGKARIREEKPLAASVHDLPEPDIAVVRIGSYASRHPSGTEAWLVIEVAWSSLDDDSRKARTYARASVPVYWLLDLANRRLLVHREPKGEHYRSIEDLREGDEVSLPGTDERWPVRTLFV